MQRRYLHFNIPDCPQKKSVMIATRKRADIDLISSKLIIIGHSRMLGDEQTVAKQCNARTE
jgi:hypothetical protein